MSSFGATWMVCSAGENDSLFKRSTHRGKKRKGKEEVHLLSPVWLASHSIWRGTARTYAFGRTKFGEEAVKQFNVSESCFGHWYFIHFIQIFF